MGNQSYGTCWGVFQREFQTSVFQANFEWIFQKEVFYLFKILCSVDPKMIPRLSQNDDEIYAKFRADFPDLKVAKLEEMKDLKSAEMKAKWRGFCDEFKHVEDYSFATLIRLDSR